MEHFSKSSITLPVASGKLVQGRICQMKFINDFLYSRFAEKPQNVCLSIKSSVWSKKIGGRDRLPRRNIAILVSRNSCWVIFVVSLLNPCNHTKNETKKTTEQSNFLARSKAYGFMRHKWIIRIFYEIFNSSILRGWTLALKSVWIVIRKQIQDFRPL